MQMQKLDFFKYGFIFRLSEHNFSKCIKMTGSTSALHCANNNIQTFLHLQQKT